MNILIIEDEIRAARRLTNLITKHLRTSSIEAYFYESLDSVSASISFFQQKPELDVLFLDIQLSDGLSFEIFENVAIQTPVIFTTAYDEFALKAFSLHSIDYLLKPIEEKALEKALEKFFSFSTMFSNVSSLSLSSHQQDNIQTLLKTLVSTDSKSYKSRFLLATANGFLSLEVANVAYFYSEHKISWLVANDGKKYSVDFTLEELASSLNPKQFFRVNRQYILSHQAIISLTNSFNGKLKAYLKPNAPDDIIIGREKATLFKEWLDS
jgi:two-component system, LytTR family, response regulator LytT